MFFVHSFALKAKRKELEVCTVSLNKRGALERLLWEQVEMVLNEVTPACIAQSVVKGEAGLSRLLLSTETLHYIYSMVLELLSSKDKTAVLIVASTLSLNGFGWHGESGTAKGQPKGLTNPSCEHGTLQT